MKKIIFLVSLLIGANSFAQVEPVYSQYMFNPVVINPAYVGVHDMASFYAMYRQQWARIDENYLGSDQEPFVFKPITTTLSGQTTLPKNNLGVGFSLVRDEIGIQTTHEFNAMLAYKIPVGSKNLSFGLQGGFMTAEFDYRGLNLDPDHVDDVYFNGTGTGSDIIPTLGVGVLWSTKRLFVGLSVPRLLETKFEDGTGTDDAPVESTLGRNVMLTGGYVFHVSKSIKIKPSALLRFTEGKEGFSDGKTTYDINTSLLINESIWTGVSMRSFSTLALMGQLKISQMFTAGMAWEFPVDSKNLTQVGHTFEIMLNFNTTLFDVQAVQTIFY